MASPAGSKASLGGMLTVIGVILALSMGGAVRAGGIVAALIGVVLIVMALKSA